MGGSRTIVGVYFKIRDEEPVLVGHYGRAHSEMRATDAIRWFHGLEDPLG
jgi:hypothetical protein